MLQMFVHSVHVDVFFIVKAFACFVCKLKWDNKGVIYLELADLMVRLTSLLTSFFPRFGASKEDSFLPVDDVLELSMTDLLGMMLSTQKDMYDETASTCLLMLLKGAKRVFQ